MKTIDEVIQWLQQLRTNALVVENPELAAHCEAAIELIRALQTQSTRDSWPNAYPTPDLELEDYDAQVHRIVSDIRGGYSTTYGTNPVFEQGINVESVVRFVLLRAISRSESDRTSGSS